jgi:hypothetical protein
VAFAIPQTKTKKGHISGLTLQQQPTIAIKHIHTAGQCAGHLVLKISTFLEVPCVCGHGRGLCLARGPLCTRVSAGRHSSIAMQGGRQAVHPELELAVDYCSELQHWDFDPMLVEVEACRAKRPP